MQRIDEVKKILAGALNVPDAGVSLDADSALLGAIPELDSMGVVSLIVALEEYFGISVDDDDISSATFATLGTLTRFIDGKLRA